MPLFNSSKVTYIITGVLAGILALLPEFIPDQWKNDIKNILGDRYPLVWTVAFISISIILLVIAWYQDKGSNSSSSNSVKITGNRNKSIQGRATSNIPTSNKADINGEDNENTQF